MALPIDIAILHNHPADPSFVLLPEPIGSFIFWPNNLRHPAASSLLYSRLIRMNHAGKGNYEPKIINKYGRNT